jgi:S-adenosylmethionine:tRNA ribosyltransferase-isomerase
MLVADFDYHLPSELIAQHPAQERDRSRLLVLERANRSIHDALFTDILDWLTPEDVLVINNTRVIPARVYGRLQTGGRLELLLLRQLEPGVWEALSRPARKARPGTQVAFDGFRAEVLKRRPEGMRVVRFEPQDISPLLKEHGELALPPYIREQCREPERYQTVYSRFEGAVAAPTAGLHFTPELLDKVRAKGCGIVEVTLHAGLGTFRPVKAETVEEHSMHPEEFELTAEAARRLSEAAAAGRRIVCVGTTSVRVVEGQARQAGDGWRLEPFRGQTDLYVHPGYEWKICGALLTNFHLPRSTLLMLVSSFAGRELVLRAYEHAIAERYRFYSFGDAMLIV